MTMPVYPAPSNTPTAVTPEPVNPQKNLAADVEAVIAAKISEVEAKYAARIKQLEDQVKAANSRQPVYAVTEHAAGPGYQQAPVWSQWLQELSRAGQLTDEILQAAGVIEKAV